MGAVVSLSASLRSLAVRLVTCFMTILVSLAKKPSALPLMSLVQRRAIFSTAILRHGQYWRQALSGYVLSTQGTGANPIG